MSEKQQQSKDSISCSVCGCMVASKTKLFRHLETDHGYIGPGTKPYKIVLIIGWLSSRIIDDPDIWSKEESYNAAMGILPGPDEVEVALSKALREMGEFGSALFSDSSSNSSSSGISISGKAADDTRPKAFARSSKSCNSSSIMVGPDVTASGICDVVSFHGRPCVPPMTDEAWVVEINKLLPSHIKVMKRSTLPSTEFEFNAEKECTHRVFEYLIPLDVLMPPTIDDDEDLVDEDGNNDDNVSDSEEEEEEEEESIAITPGQNADPALPSTSKIPRKKEFNPHFHIKLYSGSSMDQLFSRTSKMSVKRILYFRKLKKLLMRFGSFGRASYHNYAQGGINSDDAQCKRRVDRVFHKELALLPTFGGSGSSSSSSSSSSSLGSSIDCGGRGGGSDGDVSIGGPRSDTTTWTIISVSGDDFLRSQIRKMIAISIAVMRGWLPQDYIDESVSVESTMRLPAAPGVGLFYSESKFTIWESKHVNKERVMSRFILPRGIEQTFSSVLELENLKVEDSVVAGEEGSKVSTSITSSSSIKESKMVSKSSRNSEAIDPAAERINNWRHKVKVHVANQMTEVGFQWVDELKRKCLDYQRQFRRMRELKSRDLSSTGNQELLRDIPQTSPCPEVYRKVLQLLREADRSGLWPDTSLNRKRVIQEESVKDNLGGSFSVGAYPSHMQQPKGNHVFTELTRACFELERALMPGRPPSCTIAINRHAQFKAHRDSGAGNGQSVSLIVALGDFIGGEIVVEDDPFDIRYNAIEFDGWSERHWTLPFVGERYSLVWFSPNGVTTEDMWWWKEGGTPPPSIPGGGGGGGSGGSGGGGVVDHTKSDASAMMG